MNKSALTPTVLTRFDHRLVRRKARQLVGLAGFTHQDIAEIEQELLTCLLEKFSKFDHRRAHRNAFAATVVERHVASMLRHRRAAKRHPQNLTSLSDEVPVPDQGPTPLQALITEEEQDRRIGRSRRSNQMLSELKMDLAEFVPTLPEPWQRFLELRKAHGITATARLMKMPRMTLDGWIPKIRTRFIEAGFDDYL